MPFYTGDNHAGFAVLRQQVADVQIDRFRGRAYDAASLRRGLFGE
jgi:hypothetical protein